MPLSYRALQPLFAATVESVARPDQADLYLFAHSLDVEQAPRALVEDWRRRRRPVVILSEEPFWDTIWGRRPLARQRWIDTGYGRLPVIQINHQTSAVFAFDRIPYYLLTNHRFASTYAARFARNAERSAADWRALFEARQIDLSFMFERRPEPHHAVAWPEAGLRGLCSWRTELAEACTVGRVERLGRSWQGGPSRFELENWYLDKMIRMDGRARIVGAIENTHQPQYITEKIFDAFANGALPLYVAGPGHRLREFGLPEPSWLNLWGLSPAGAADRIAGQRWTRELFEAYAEAQHRLAALFCDPALWVAERTRLADALQRELQAVLETAAPATG
ncbi:hypothetical protein QO033_24895 [Pseudodonghicola sp. IC7]|uniref:Glycosyltransferase family 1 protein n=2 Tax=Pseudodonghicola flavimaris TaxID=3050036 RepID=A0ABT7F8K0_9RHOB|nr:hypothetical protein [Pseudodonghicola flavimaris]